MSATGLKISLAKPRHVLPGFSLSMGFMLFYMTSLMLIFHPRVGGPATAALIANTMWGLVGFSACLFTVHLATVPLGTWAILVNGTFFAALSIRSRNRELLLPLILFPIFMPALLSMVLAISAILSGDADPALWIKMLSGYDIIFTAISLLLFETVLNAE